MTGSQSVPWIVTRPLRQKEPLEMLRQVIYMLGPDHKHLTPVRLVPMADGTTAIVCDECLAKAAAAAEDDDDDETPAPDRPSSWNPPISTR